MRVPTELLEEADDADDIRSTVIDLILQHTLAGLQEQAKNDPSDTGLRAELTSLRLKELRARAKAEGVDADRLDDAMDEDDPNEAVVQLLLDAQSAAEGAREQLSGLRLKELRARASQAGHSAEDLEDAIDSDEPKAAVIELLLSPWAQIGEPPLTNDHLARPQHVVRSQLAVAVDVAPPARLARATVGRGLHEAR